MKKLLAILLALMMVLVSVTALAGDLEGEGGNNTPSDDTSTWKSDATTFTENGFKKSYATSGTSTTIFPAEPVNFTSVPDSGNPDTTNITIDEYVPTASSGYLTVNVPSYSKVGVYKYTISEETPETVTQGVTYATNTVGLTVLVSYDYTNKKLVPEVIGITKNADGEKEDTFENTYALGQLTVGKTVEGNLGKRDQLFDITVTLTSEGKVYSDISVSGGSNEGNAQTITGNGWTGNKVVSIKLKHGESVVLTNIPSGVTYAVAEDNKHAAADPNGTDGAKGYTITYSGAQTGAISTTDSSATVVNTKAITVDTGIALDSTVYMLILALALAGIVVLKIRRREDY